MAKRKQQLFGSELVASQDEHDIEHGIAPPMRAAITIPVLLDGVPTGVSIYVASSTFDTRNHNAVIERVAGLVRRALR